MGTGSVAGTDVTGHRGRTWTQGTDGNPKLRETSAQRRRGHRAGGEGPTESRTAACRRTFRKQRGRLRRDRRRKDLASDRSPRSAPAGCGGALGPAATALSEDKLGALPGRTVGLRPRGRARTASPHRTRAPRTAWVAGPRPPAARGGRGGGGQLNIGLRAGGAASAAGRTVGRPRGGSGVRSCSEPSAQCPAGCGEPLGAGVLIFGSGKWDSRGRVWLTRLSQGGDVTWADGLVTDKAGGADAKGHGSPVTEGGGEAGGHSRWSRSGALTGGLEQTTGTVGHQDGGRRGSPERSCPLQLRDDEGQGAGRGGPERGSGAPHEGGGESRPWDFGSLGWWTQEAVQSERSGKGVREEPAQREKDGTRRRREGPGRRAWTAPRWIKAANAYSPRAGKHLSSSRPPKERPESRTRGSVFGRRALRSEAVWSGPGWR